MNLTSLRKVAIEDGSHPDRKKRMSSDKKSLSALVDFYKYELDR